MRISLASLISATLCILGASAAPSTKDVYSLRIVNITPSVAGLDMRNVSRSDVGQPVGNLGLYGGPNYRFTLHPDPSGKPNTYRLWTYPQPDHGKRELVVAERGGNAPPKFPNMKLKAMPAPGNAHPKTQLWKHWQVFEMNRRRGPGKMMVLRYADGTTNGSGVGHWDACTMSREFTGNDINLYWMVDPDNSPQAELHCCAVVLQLIQA